jgi:hypothetical protein
MFDNYKKKKRKLNLLITIDRLIESIEYCWEYACSNNDSGETLSKNVKSDLDSIIKNIDNVLINANKYEQLAQNKTEILNQLRIDLKTLEQETSNNSLKKIIKFKDTLKEYKNKF